jgi:hypothetical protein
MLRLFILFQLLCLLAVSHRAQGEGLLGDILTWGSAEGGIGDRTQGEGWLRGSAEEGRSDRTQGESINLLRKKKFETNLFLNNLFYKKQNSH